MVCREHPADGSHVHIFDVAQASSRHLLWKSLSETDGHRVAVRECPEARKDFFASSCNEGALKTSPSGRFTHAPDDHGSPITGSVTTSDFARRLRVSTSFPDTPGSRAIPR